MELKKVAGLADLAEVYRPILINRWPVFCLDFEMLGHGTILVLFVGPCSWRRAMAWLYRQQRQRVQRDAAAGPSPRPVRGAAAAMAFDHQAPTTRSRSSSSVNRPIDISSEGADDEEPELIIDAYCY